GIRDRNVTGVQTCALPISLHRQTHVRWTSGYQQRLAVRSRRWPRFCLQRPCESVLVVGWLQPLDRQLPDAERRCRQLPSKQQTVLRRVLLRRPKGLPSARCAVVPMNHAMLVTLLSCTCTRGRDLFVLKKIGRAQ